MTKAAKSTDSRAPWTLSVTAARMNSPAWWEDYFSEDWLRQRPLPDASLHAAARRSLAAGRCRPVRHQRGQSPTGAAPSARDRANWPRPFRPPRCAASTPGARGRAGGDAAPWPRIRARRPCGAARRAAAPLRPRRQQQLPRALRALAGRAAGQPRVHSPAARLVWCRIASSRCRCITSSACRRTRSRPRSTASLACWRRPWTSIRSFWPSGRQLVVAYASPRYFELRDRRRASTAGERAKWDAYYADLALQPIDAPTAAFNDELAGIVRELLPAGGAVLEAGCGGGSQSLAIAQRRLRRGLARLLAGRARLRASACSRQRRARRLRPGRRVRRGRTPSTTWSSTPACSSTTRSTSRRPSCAAWRAARAASCSC